MKAFLSLLALVPGMVFASPLILELHLSKGQMEKIKIPVITYKATNALCTEGGITPLPWRAPKEKKVEAKVISRTEDDFVVEVPVKLEKDGFCNYKFNDVTLWYKGEYFVAVEALNPTRAQDVDATKIELANNPNSLFGVECKTYSDLSKSCQMTKDGKRVGFSRGNGSRFLLQVEKANKLPEVRTSIDLSFE